jgi:hypothetical protein
MLREFGVGLLVRFFCHGYTVVAAVPAGVTPGSMPIGAGKTAGFIVPENTTHVASI